MSRVLPEDLAEALDITFFDYQVEAFDGWDQQGGDPERRRACLYYRTGAGKTITALCMLALNNDREALVIAPPVTHAQWQAVGVRLGITLTIVSHAKFRQSGFKIRKDQPVICDEFHLLGGHKGQGWKKFDRLSGSLQAPVIICSATPNYNDAERCYCIKRIVDLPNTKGGYIQFLYTACSTEQNPFGMEPLVTGFLHHANAAEYLASLPNVYYLEDTAVFTIEDVPYTVPPQPELDQFGLSVRDGRIMASGIEERWQRTYHGLLDDEGNFRQPVLDIIETERLASSTPVLMFCASARVAAQLADAYKHLRVGLVTGGNSSKEKMSVIDAFRHGKLDVLIGTATLASGTDGVDVMCDTLIIVNDTDDAAMRRQLIGRILPRGAAIGSTKTIVRMVPDGT